MDGIASQFTTAAPIPTRILRQGDVSRRRDRPGATGLLRLFDKSMRTLNGKNVDWMEKVSDAQYRR
jgi:hypothetical protein